jgi:hypothetical protein
VTDEQTQLDRIEALLTEIRDRLPAQPRQASAYPTTLFGYHLGQDEPPDFHQAQLAGMLLRGELADWSTRATPVIAYQIAEEIAGRALKADR